MVEEIDGINTFREFNEIYGPEPAPVELLSPLWIEVYGWM
jgi:hypothetical protein